MIHIHDQYYEARGCLYIVCNCIDSSSVTKGMKGQDNDPRSGQKICSECVQTVRLFVFTPFCSSKQIFFFFFFGMPSIDKYRCVSATRVDYIEVPKELECILVKIRPKRLFQQL